MLSIWKSEMNTNVPILLTTGRIAFELDVPFYRVCYVLMTRNHIRPVARAGNIRLYDSQGVAAIRHELAMIEARRGIVDEA